MKCDIVVVAAGLGSRFGKPKQFEEIQGKPLYQISLDTFSKWPRAGRACLVVPAGFEGIQTNAVVTVGGATRQESAQRGLLALGDSKYVMIHDAARPCFDVDLLDRLFDELLNSNAEGVVPALQVSDTVKEVSGSEVKATLQRQLLRLVQTPQIFRSDFLKAAYQKNPDLNAFDDSFVVEKAGGKVIVAEGQRSNIKITYPEDLNHVSNWIRDRHPSL